MINRFLFHGSSNALIGDSLEPNLPDDLGSNPFQKLRAVYATNKRELAVAFAITSLEGVGRASVSFDFISEPVVYITGGLVDKNSNLYVYKLPPNGFKKVKGSRCEFYCLGSVKPLGLEVLKLKDYLRFVRKGEE